MLTDIYLGSSYSLLGGAVGKQIMNCFLPKPESCPERRVQTHPPWLIRGHPGEAADWAVGHRTLPVCGERSWHHHLLCLILKEIMQEYEKSYFIRFFTFSSNLCWLEHPRLHSAQHQWQKWRRHSSCWVVKFPGKSTLAGQDFIQMESQEGEAKTFQGEGTSVTMWGKMSDA